MTLTDNENIDVTPPGPVHGLSVFNDSFTVKPPEMSPETGSRLGTESPSDQRQVGLTVERMDTKSPKTTPDQKWIRCLLGEESGVRKMDGLSLTVVPCFTTVTMTVGSKIGGRTDPPVTQFLGRFIPPRRAPPWPFESEFIEH